MIYLRIDVSDGSSGDLLLLRWPQRPMTENASFVEFMIALGTAWTAKECALQEDLGRNEGIDQELMSSAELTGHRQGIRRMVRKFVAVVCFVGW